MNWIWLLVNSLLRMVATKTITPAQPMKMEIKAPTGVGGSVQVTKIPGPESNPRQLVVRRINWKDKKEPTEKQAAENLCKFTNQSSWKLEAGKENGPVDITARSPEGESTEDFQIVRLWEQDDWQALNANGAVDRDYSKQEAVDLFKRVFGNKGIKKYPASVRQRLTLLIDANPIANVSDFVGGVENEIAQLACQSGYKAVWVVGTTDARELDYIVSAGD